MMILRSYYALPLSRHANAIAYLDIFLCLLSCIDHYAIATVTLTPRCNQAEDIQKAVQLLCGSPQTTGIFAYAIDGLNEETLRDMYGKPACGASQVLDDDTQLKMINGIATEPHALPWMASIGAYGKQYCGGALMNKRFVVTAKHCFYDPATGEPQQPLEDVRITLGVNHLQNPPEATAQVFEVGSLVQHDVSDLIVVRLKTDARLNYNVWPLWFRPGKRSTKNPLYGPNTAEKEEQGVALAAGWGVDKEGNKNGTDDLMQAILKLRHDQVCIDAFKARKHPYDHLTMLCAGGVCVEDVDCTLSDSCQGDSGGPLMYLHDGTWILLGVTSYGRGCAKKAKPGAYVFVYRLRDWLEQQIKIQ